MWEHSKEDYKDESWISSLDSDKTNSTETTRDEDNLYDKDSSVVARFEDHIRNDAFKSTIDYSRRYYFKTLKAR